MNYRYEVEVFIGRNNLTAGERYEVVGLATSQEAAAKLADKLIKNQPRKIFRIVAVIQ